MRLRRLKEGLDSIYVPLVRVLCIGCFAMGPLQAATLQSSGTVKGGKVYLSDVFEGLRSGQDKLLGPAPPPGKSITIGGAQLIALADQYGVDWDDQSSTATLVLTSAGRLLGRDYYTNLIKKMLVPEGNAAGYAVELNNFTPVTVGPEDEDPMTVSNLDWDRKTGKFSAMAALTHPSGNPNMDNIMLRGVIRPVQPVVVYSHTMPVGHIIEQGDMRVDQSYSGPVPPLTRALPGIDSMEGMALARTVAEGQLVQGSDLRRAVLVHQGDPVLIVYKAPGLRLTATGRALEDGGSGQFVHALNVGNRMILTGKVTAGGEVRVDAASNAIAMDSKEARRLGISSTVIKAGDKP